MKEFVILRMREDREENVLGSSLSEDNPYVSCYSEPVKKGDPEVLSLQVGESVERLYRLNGGRGVYLVKRVK